MGLLMVFLCYLFLLPSSPSHKTFISANDVQENSTVEEGQIINDQEHIRSHQVVWINVGTNGGRSYSNGENSGGAASKSPYTPGTSTAVIPIYVAGAANNHRPHKQNAAPSNHINIGLTSTRLAIFALLLLLLLFL